MEKPIDVLSGRPPAEIAWAARVLQQALGLRPADAKPAFPVIAGSPEPAVPRVLSYAVDRPAIRPALRIEQHDGITVIELPAPGLRIVARGDLLGAVIVAILVSFTYFANRHELLRWPWLYWVWLGITATVLIGSSAIVLFGSLRRIRFAVSRGAIRMIKVGLLRTRVRQYDRVDRVGVIGSQLWWLDQEGVSRCLFENASRADLDLLSRTLTTALNVDRAVPS